MKNPARCPGQAYLSTLHVSYHFSVQCQ